MSGQVRKIQRHPRVVGLTKRPNNAAAFDEQSGEFPDTVTLINPHFDITEGRANLSASDFSGYTSALIEKMSMFGQQVTLDVIVMDFLTDEVHGERWIVTVNEEIETFEQDALASSEGHN